MHPPPERLLEMRDDFTEIVFILDRSGSMDSIRDDAIGAFNAFIEDQKKIPGDANLTLVLFNHEYKEVYGSKDLKEAQPITAEDYVPSGMTAMLDAIGRTISAVGERLAAMPEDKRPGKVAVAIMTDGMENDSKGYTLEQVKTMIEHQESAYKWCFFFLGANIDAFAAGSGIAIKAASTLQYDATGAGVRKAMHSYSATLCSFRSGDTDSLIADPPDGDNTK